RPSDTRHSHLRRGMPTLGASLPEVCPVPSPVTLPPRRAGRESDLPLPTRLRRPDDDRLRRYRENLDFYEGRQWPGRARRGERRLTFNYAKAFADKVTSYLLTGLAVQVEAADGDTPAGRERARIAERALRDAEAANFLAQ